MRKIGGLLCGLGLLALGGWSLSLAEQTPLTFTGGGTVKAYLPGDVVHIVVTSPPDTVRVVTSLPDGTRLDLDYEGRTYSWHGHWAVPFGFKKGTYYAKIIATDVEGRTFEGVTGSFYVGEPALVTMIGRQSTVEVPAEKELIQKMQAEIAFLYQEIKKRPSTAPLEKTLEVAGGKKIVVRAPKRKKPLDRSVQKAALITRARAALVRSDYQQARRELASLVRLDPDNAQLKRFRDRLQEIVQARKTTQ